MRDITLSNERKAATLKFSKVMLQIEHDIECTPVTDATMLVSQTSTRYAFTLSSFLCSVYN